MSTDNAKEYQIGVLIRPSGLYESLPRMEHPVLLWDGYGVVIPTLITTNGSANAAARCIRDCVVRGYEWRGPDVDTEGWWRRP